MVESLIPRYPIYIPTKSRYDRPLTIQALQKDSVPFRIVIEPQEFEHYAALVDEKDILVLPWSDLGTGGLIAVRNWIKEHSMEAGDVRHWQLDDNIGRMFRRYRGKRVPIRMGIGFRVIEDFVDRYKNIAIAGPNYDMFGVRKKTAFTTNCHVYSATLVLNEIPFKWRLDYNDDTDMCLQVLAGGWCTVLVHAYLVEKKETMSVKGGNTPIYQGDGRLKMARMLERQWPGVASTYRRFGRPQHLIKNHWKNFDTPLMLKDGIDLDELRERGPDEYGMHLTQVEPKVKSARLRKMLRESQAEQERNSTENS